MISRAYSFGRVSCSISEECDKYDRSDFIKVAKDVKQVHEIIQIS